MEVPGGVAASEEAALVETVWGFGPELDRLGVDAEDSPVVGAGRGKLLDLGEVGQAGSHLLQVGLVDRASLAGDDRL